MTPTSPVSTSPRFSALPAIAATVLSLAAAPAGAHFLWLTIDGETPPSANVTFGETPDERTTAVPVSKLGDAKVRNASGAALAVTAGEAGYRGALSGSPVASASQSWGVVDRSGDGTGAFLLEYYAKGAAGIADASADLKLPVEIFARQDGNQIALSVQKAGQGVAAAPVKVHLPGGQTLDLTADEQGNASFDAAGGGVYGLRSRWTDGKKGETGGKKYGETRQYATLTFALPGAPATASQSAGAKTPPAAVTDTAVKPAAADPAAYSLLKGAHDSRQVMPAEYGFRADLVLQIGDAVYAGRLVYRRQGETEVQIDGVDPESLEWARSQILNLVGHRRGGDFAKGDGRYPLQLGPQDDSSYGRLILVNDAAKSSYRVRDNRVREVTRTMGDSRFTISVIETMDADSGKYLANHFVVSYRDAATGALQKIEGYRDGYARVDGVWLPASRTVLEVNDSTSPIVRTVRFRNPSRLDAPAATAEAR